MKSTRINRFSVSAVATIVLAACQPAPEPTSTPGKPVADMQLDKATLVAGFQNPPNSARPRVWWHWMNGNVSKEGIAKDLAWMQRVGIGGLQSFDANLETPQIVPERLVYMSPPWQDAFTFAAGEAARYDMELAIASSPGWSETGGPWVPPEDGMKKLSWSEFDLVDGRTLDNQIFNGQLPQPFTTTGEYKDLSSAKQHGINAEKMTEPPSYYRDIAVYAYPLSAQNLPAPTYQNGTGEPLNAEALLDASLQTSVAIAKPAAGSNATITMQYQQPQTVRSFTLYASNTAPNVMAPGYSAELEANIDGDWQTIAQPQLSGVPTTVSFAPVKASLYRLQLSPPQRGGFDMAAMPAGIDLSALAALGGSDRSTQLQIAELRLSNEARVHQFETKAGFSVAPDYYTLNQPSLAGEAGVPADSIINLSEYLDAKGKLNWTPPLGNWRILRLGYSLTGRTNHPATAEATGLEVDKLDPAAVRRYLEHYLGTYRDTVGNELMGERGLRALLTDSTEVGAFNWTADMVDHFQRLRGYDPKPWLPTLTGTLIGNRQQSNAFLYDFRRTIAELHAESHYGTVAAVAHEHGLKLYGEALENGRPSLGDDMALRSHADYPMAAMWHMGSSSNREAVFTADMKGAASVAHIYGRNIAAAESMTSALSPWASGPKDLVNTVNTIFANGINRVVIHTSVHQPMDEKAPGLSLGIFGQFFNRHESWAELAKPWIDYISRSAYLLQQGRNVADVAYFYGEDAPLVSLYQKQHPVDIPTQYAYDYLNYDALLNELSVNEGELVSRGGARYRVLYLGGTSQQMTLPVLQRIVELVTAGATVVGHAPVGSPALQDSPVKYATLVEKLWPAGSINTRIGKGRVIASKNIEAALATIDVAPDFSYQSADTNQSHQLQFVHRRFNQNDHIYYVVNRKNHLVNVQAQFRVSGKTPAIWRADSGMIEPVCYIIEGDTTTVPLELLPEEAVFVVFIDDAAEKAIQISKLQPSPVQTIAGEWQVQFEANRGAPANITMAQLTSLSEHDNPGVKYFSGVASYRNHFTLSELPTEQLWLDLGEIGDVAEVWVNGLRIGGVWKPPYRLDVSAALREGENQLEIKVANLWVNRLIGDKQANVERVAYTTIPTYIAQAPLRPAGLIGPVQLLQLNADIHEE